MSLREATDSVDVTHDHAAGAPAVSAAEPAAAAAAAATAAAAPITESADVAVVSATADADADADAAKDGAAAKDGDVVDESLFLKKVSGRARGRGERGGGETPRSLFVARSRERCERCGALRGETARCDRRGRADGALMVFCVVLAAPQLFLLCFFVFTPFLTFFLSFFFFPALFLFISPLVLCWLPSGTARGL